MIQVKNIDPPDEKLVPPGMELMWEYEHRVPTDGEIYLDTRNNWKLSNSDNVACTFIVALTRPKAPVLPKCPWCGEELRVCSYATYQKFWVSCERNNCFFGPDFTTREQAISETIRVLGKGS
jgi:hypothetical protein